MNDKAIANIGDYVYMFNAPADATYTETQKAFEKYWLEKTMRECRYNQVKAAKALGMSRGTLRTKLARHFGDTYFKNKD